MALLKRFRIGDIDGDGIPDPGGYRTSVVFRPFHEVNGGFFWWGKPNAADYLQLWSNMISRSAGEGGVYNLIWAYSGNRDTSTTTDPATYTPYAVDIGALDTYDPEQGKGNAVDALGLEGYSAIARSQFGKVHRMALTEVGPHGSADTGLEPRRHHPDGQEGQDQAALVDALVRRRHAGPGQGQRCLGLQAAQLAPRRQGLAQRLLQQPLLPQVAHPLVE